MTQPDADKMRPDDAADAARSDGAAEGRDDVAGAADKVAEGGPRVVRRREPAEMSAEERAFLARHQADMPPHHDSSWG